MPAKTQDYAMKEEEGNDDREGPPELLAASSDAISHGSQAASSSDRCPLLPTAAQARREGTRSP